MKVFGQQKFLALLAILYFGIFCGTSFAKRLPVKIYTSADGLGSGFVDYLMNDSRGFMWFCTRDGLSRFDGSRFVTYQVGDKDSPPGIEQIFESRSGIYWIITTRGTYRFNPNDVSQIDPNSSRLKAEFIAVNRGQFFEDSKGNFWSTAPELSLIHDNNGKVDYEKYDLNLPPEINANLSIHSIAESIDGSIWLNSNKGLLRLLPDKHIVHYSVEEIKNSGNTFLTTDKKGFVWFSLDNILLAIKPEPAEFFADTPLTTKSLKPSSEIELKPEESYQMPQKDGEIFRFINKQENFIEKSFSKRVLETSDGNIWISAENNLLELANNGVFHLHSDNEGLPTVMWQMAEDAAGNLWIGGFSGLARIDRHGMTSYGVNDGANSSRFFAINEDQNGKLYFSSLDYYLNFFDGNKLNTLRPQIPPGSIALWTSRPAFLDSNNNWWFLTSNQLFYFAGIADFPDLKDKPPTKVYSMNDGLSSNAVLQVFEDSANNIWASTVDTTKEGTRTLRLKKGEDKFYAFSEADGLPNNKSFSSAVEDWQGNIWFSFYKGGLARFNGEKFDYWGEDEKFLNGAVTDLYLDKKGRLWIASSIEGLYRIDDTSAKKPDFLRITTADGLWSNNIRTITGDNFGRIYLGSARGVDRLSPDTGYVKHYSANDGLATDFVADSHCDKNGDLWFVTNSGISKLTPQSEEKTFPPRILIGNLWVAGEQQAISQIGSLEIERNDLSANQNNLRIDFFGLDFRAGETLRYQYKLEGTNEDWSLPNDQRTVNFANLSAGNYRFLVRAVNSEGQSSENPAIITFRILPPFYARWSFIITSLAIVSLIIYTFYRYRISNLEAINAALEETKKAKEERLAELEQVRTRIASDLHDDIGSSLTQIAVLSEVARGQASYLEAENLSMPLERIKGVSKELVSVMSDIVWAINPTKDNLPDLVQRMRRFGSDVLSGQAIKFNFHTPDIEDNFQLGANIRREFFAIFKESVNNIVKYAEATEVKVDFQIQADTLHLKIEDNGKGFNTAEILSENFKPEMGGNGLVNMRRRAKDLGGTCEIMSEIDQGTKIELKVPLHHPENSLSK